jgi:hypothetical protein
MRQLLWFLPSQNALKHCRQAILGGMPAYGPQRKGAGHLPGQVSGGQSGAN